MIEEVAVHWTTVAAFWATIVVALVTIIATAINYYVLRTQSDPHVVIYALSDQTRPSVINIVIENVGKGLAKNVRFDFSEPIVRAYGLQEGTADVRDIPKGPLTDGIPGLGPGTDRVITWGQFWGLYHVYGDRAITVRVRYRSDSVGIFGPKECETICYLDVRSFASVDVSDSRWDKHAADALKEISKVLKGIREELRSP